MQIRSLRPTRAFPRRWETGRRRIDRRHHRRWNASRADQRRTAAHRPGCRTPPAADGKRHPVSGTNGPKAGPDSVTKEVKSMMIHEEICVGCGRCQPYCPTTAIRYDGSKSRIDQDVCYECSTCLRAAHCPVDAIAESPNVYDYPRALRRYFSDPSATHAATGIQGRGTEESKTNDVTLRVGPGEVGVAIEIGRPTLGMSILDIQKITRAIARVGVHKIEPHNPIHSMIADEATGDLKPEMLGNGCCRRSSRLR